MQGQPVTDYSNDLVVCEEVTVRGVLGHDHRSVEPALAIIGSGRYPLELLPSGSFGLEDVDGALRVAGERTDPDAIHVTVVP